MKSYWKFVVLLISLLALVYVYQQEQIIRRFSFDFNSKHLPDSYHTFGAAAKLKNKIKLIPAVDLRYGGVFINQKFRSSSFSVDFTYKMNSPTESSDGFVFWFSPELPEFETKSGRIHGVGKDTKGYSIWFHKDNRGKTGTR